MLEKKNKKTFHVLQDYAKFKRLILKLVKQQQYEKALKTIYFASGFMYTMNQLFVDEELEKIITDIAAHEIPQNAVGNTISRNIICYDGFGNLKRGLLRIYVEALQKMGYTVQYITFDCHKTNREEFYSVLKQEHVYFVQGSRYLEQIHSLYSIIGSCEADKAFLCMNPDDVVGIAAFSRYEGIIRRYLLNITDHAFWLGKNICDKVINFREFGGKFCICCRKIPSDKMAYIPYYPFLEARNKNVSEKKYRFLFSGGNMYKTQSRDKKYYELVDRILSTFDVHFIYMGNGISRDFHKLKKKHPAQVSVFRESKDFFHILKKSVFYLSTYPYNGGLMTQYALAAKKIPITLSCPGIEKELTINHERVYWNYNTIEDCIKQIRRLISEESYRKEQEEKLKEFLLTPEMFLNELQFFLTNEESIRKIRNGFWEYEGFMQMPLECYRGMKYARLFYRKNGFYLCTTFPVKYIIGLVYMLGEKISEIGVKIYED